MSEPATKQCPFCAEKIKAAALLCRFCGRDLPGATAPAPPPAPAPALELAVPSPLLPRTEILDLLASLVQKSLAVYEEDEHGNGRYRLLETVRQYGRDRLVEAGEGEELRGRHLKLFEELTERARPELMAAQQLVWFERLEAEHPNLRTAIRWAQEGEQAEVALRMVGALEHFWSTRGYLEEGREALLQILAMPQAVKRTAARAAALSAAGYLTGGAAALSFHKESLEIRRELGDQLSIASSLVDMARTALIQGDYPIVASYADEGLRLYRELGDHEGIARTLHILGIAAAAQGDYQRATALHQESLFLARQEQNKYRVANALGGLADVARYQGDCERASALYQESLALFQEAGAKPKVAWTLILSGFVAYARADLDAARSLAEQSLAIQRDMREKEEAPWALLLLGRIACRQGELPVAESLLKQSLAEFGDEQERQNVAECLEALAGVVTSQGEHARATHLLGAASILREAIGAPLHPSDHAEHEQRMDATRRALGEEAFAAAWAEGRAMSLPQAVEYALEREEGDS